MDGHIKVLTPSIDQETDLRSAGKKISKKIITLAQRGQTVRWKFVIIILKLMRIMRRLICILLPLIVTRQLLAKTMILGVIELGGLSIETGVVIMIGAI